MRPIYLYFLFIIFHFNLIGQELNSKINHILFSNYKFEEPNYRTLVKFKTNSKINVIKWISSRTLYFYQNSISEQIQSDCMYEVSCSQYTKKMIEKKGLIFGVLLGFHQLNNCHPSVAYDYPSFKINEEEKINNHSHFE